MNYSQHNHKFSIGETSSSPHFDYQAYVRDGITFQDVLHIKQAFDNLRDENDRPNEIKLSKLKMFPFFTKQDIARIPRESERYRLAMEENENQGMKGSFGRKHDENCDSMQQMKIMSNQNSGQLQSKGMYYGFYDLGSLKMEGKGIDCQTIMCGCGPQRGTYPMGIQQSVSFDQFFDIMSEKIKEARPNQSIIFESKVSNVSCFFWPLFGTQ